MGPTKSSHALNYYSKYGKMKDLKNMIIDTKVLHSILWRVRRERAPIAVNRLDCAAFCEQA